MHGGLKTRTRVNMHYIESTDIEQQGTACAGRDGCDPGAGRLRRARHRRQDPGGRALRASTAFRTWASAWACRSPSSSSGATCSGLTDANSTEFNRATPHPVIALITEWQDQARGVAAARREVGQGRHHAPGRPGSAARRRHAGARALRPRRHHGAPSPPLRVQQQLPGALPPGAGCGSRASRADGLVEIIELPSHPWFVATQFHPEFTSTPRDGHPLFTGFIRAARAHRAAQLPASGRCMKLAGLRGRAGAAVVSDRRALRHRGRDADAGDRRPR